MTDTLRSITGSGEATIDYTGRDACVLTVTGKDDYRRAYEHDTYAFEDAAALGFPADSFRHDTASAGWSRAARQMAGDGPDFDGPVRPVLPGEDF